MVVVYATAGIKMNVGAQFMDECRYFYARERSPKDLFLNFFIVELCN